MLNRTFEWYRIVNVKPTSQMIDNRIAAVHDLLETIDQESDWNLVLGYAVGVVAGFDVNFAQDSPVVDSLVSSIRAHESAFPEDLSENALELRACAAVALGEIMVRGGDQALSADALLVASVLRSGLGPRPSVTGKHLKQMLDELDSTATKLLASEGISRRERLITLAQQFEKLPEPPDLPTAWKSLVPSLKAAMKDIVQQSAIDREELNVLWWMFAGTSTTTGYPIAEMSAGAAVLCCGAELGSQCLIPPTSSLEAMARRAYEVGRKRHDLTDRSIEKIAADWDNQFLSVLVPDEEAQVLAKDYPSLFPLSWICARLLASKGTSSWFSEFERMTGIPSNYACPPANWAIQAFRERVAHRIYKGLDGG
jgi:hypothetical protein